MAIKTNNNKKTDFPPPDLPPGKNLFIVFWKFFIMSSILGGSLLVPEPFPLPPGVDPQGDEF
jgi:hypothetical protein